MVSTKPYLVRAIYEWCMDQGFTPFIAARVDANTRVPPGYARDGQIVLNVAPDATHQLSMDNELVSFQARFNGVAHHLSIPMGNVVAIYARENGLGMFDKRIQSRQKLLGRRTGNLIVEIDELAMRIVHPAQTQLKLLRPLHLRHAPLSCKTSDTRLARFIA